MLILLVYDADYIIKQDWKRCETQDSIHCRWHLAGFLWFSLFTGPSAWEWTMSCTERLAHSLSEYTPWTTRKATAKCWPPWTLSRFLIPSKRVDIHIQTGSLRFDDFSHSGPFWNPFPLVEQEKSSSFCNVCHEKWSNDWFSLYADRYMLQKEELFCCPT
jgi:hypothetical protein